MKRVLISAILFPLTLCVSPAIHRADISDHITTLVKYEKFVNALTWVESRHDSLAVGSAHDLGLFQITPIRLLDYNRRTGKHYTDQDLFNPRISRIIFDYYSKDLPFEEAARKWNRAYQWRDSLGTVYWNRVSKQLNKLSNEN